MQQWYMRIVLFVAVLTMSGVVAVAQPAMADTSLPGDAEAQLSVQAASIFAKAEVLYPELFSEPSGFRAEEGFIYKFYAAQHTYIGIRDEMVYLLGGPFGNAITNYGTVTDTLAYLVNVENLALSYARDAVFADAWENLISGLQAQGEGLVSRVLADDLAGDRHQRFIVRLRSGQTLLVSHNIDLAPHVAAIAVGDEIMFYGVYEWSTEGGVIHWTHHDPNGEHVPGWIRYKGITYQ